MIRQFLNPSDLDDTHPLDICNFGRIIFRFNKINEQIASNVI